MPFKRFFGRGKDDAPAPPPADEEVGDDVEGENEATDAVDEVEPGGILEADDIDHSWRERAAAVIPGGSSTGSKQPRALYGRADVVAPGHYLRASGCEVTSSSERTFIDCTMALGAVSLGYADDGVTRAVVAAVASSPVTGLPSVLEPEIAERLCDVIPCAERVRFLKSGAEAVSAAIRVARTATGRATVIASGYFGWHDWANTGAGIPANIDHRVRLVPFDDVGALRAAADAAGHDLAAIVIEPVVERLPSPGWIDVARSLCTRLGAVLVFDEMKTGFRLATGGFQAHGGVTPDLAVFGKALGNGMPIAALVGREAVMQAASQTWISSTAAAEAASLAAVGAVLERYAEVDVCAALARAGAQMRSSLEHAIHASGVSGVRVDGLDPMWILRFDEPAFESRFLERAVANGVLFKRGAYNYPSLAHDDEQILMEIERVASSTLVELQEEDET